jgi:hypothetical protein
MMYQCVVNPREVIEVNEYRSCTREIRLLNQVFEELSAVRQSSEPIAFGGSSEPVIESHSLRKRSQPLSDQSVHHPFVTIGVVLTWATRIHVTNQSVVVDQHQCDSAARLIWRKCCHAIKGSPGPPGDRLVPFAHDQRAPPDRRSLRTILHRNGDEPWLHLCGRRV